MQLSWQQQIVDCQQHLLINNQQWQLQHMQFYLSDFSLNQQPLSLATTSWQQPQLALLGTDCQGNSNWQLQFMQPISAGTLRFTLGLPFSINHQNPLTATAPLNNSAMFWSWQLGYKFLRLDLQGPDYGWAFHLGSTGCQSASVLRPPAMPCQHANAVEVVLDYQPGQQLQLNLERLLSDIPLLSDNSCMSDAQQQSCQMLFSNTAAPGVWQFSAAL